MKQNLLHYTPEDVFGLPGLDEKYQWAAIDADEVFCFYTVEPNADLNYDEWSNDVDTFVMPLKTDYTGDWRESKIQRPVTIELGVFGKFWDHSKNSPIYGWLLEKQDTISQFSFRRGNVIGEFSEWWHHFEPCDPATLPKQIEIK